MAARTEPEPDAAATQADRWTVGRLLTWTTDYLKQHGADSPRLDAEVLLAHARGCPRIELYTNFDDEAVEPVRTAFRELVRRRAEGTPVAYLVGYREFYSLRFRVTPDVLIPRPETESLVVALRDWAKTRPANSQPLRIADVGTGSGVLAVCAAKYLPTSRVTAIDISAAALEVARANAKELGVADRVTFVESDLLGGSPPEAQFDLVISNPPYISTAEMAELPPHIRSYEPKLALDAGDRGMDVIERLIPQAAERLTPAGQLFFEISPMLEAAARSAVEAESRLWLAPTIKDLAAQARVIAAARVGRL